jgi:hypothetical protein
MGDTGTEDNDVEAHDAAAPRSTAAVAGLENDTEKNIGTAMLLDMLLLLLHVRQHPLLLLRRFLGQLCARWQ